LGEGIVGEFGMDMYTPLCVNWIADKLLLYNTWNSAQWSMAAGQEGSFGGEWIQTYVWLCPFPVHLKLSQDCLIIGYNNKKWKVFLKKITSLLLLVLFCKWCLEIYMHMLAIIILCFVISLIYLCKWFSEFIWGLNARNNFWLGGGKCLK